MAKKKKDIINLIISDTQAPFHHPDTLDFLAAVKKKYKPTEVFHVGDEVDFNFLSNWAKDPDGYGGNEEYFYAMDFMHQLYKLFPKVKACNSNHTDRVFRKAFDSQIPIGFMKEKHEWMEAPKGWKWADEHYTKDGIMVLHGDGLKGGLSMHQKAMKDNMCSIIFGHFHTSAKLEYFANSKTLIFAMSVGCLIDHKLYAFKYQKKNMAKPILSVGITINGVPKLVPMIVNNKGRWIGEVY